MADYFWPGDIVPFAVSFYLQAHSGGTESPFNRQTKVYGLSAPRWVCRMSFRGGYNNSWGDGVGEWGARLDAFIAKLRGRQNRVALWDHRRAPAAPLTNAAILEGATTVTFTDGVPKVGYYIGGDGRPHLITEVVGSVATVEPPFRSAVDAGPGNYGNAYGFFRLTSDDAGANPTEVGQLTQYDLELVEDLAPGTIEISATIIGDPIVGSTLTTDTPWGFYQWYADGVAIPGADSSNYTITADDEGAMISVSVGISVASVSTAPVGPVVDVFVGTVMANAYYAAGFINMTDDPDQLAFRAYRDADAVEMDIGFNPDGSLDVDALETFAGAGDVRVKTLYAQIGSPNLTFATANRLPLIVVAGIVLTAANGLPAMRFVTANSGTKLQGAFTAPIAQPNHVYIVQQNEGAALTSNRDVLDFATTGQRHIFRFTASTSASMLATTALTATSMRTTNLELWRLEYNTTSSRMIRNGTVVATGNVSTNTMGGIHLGGQTANLINPSLFQAIIVVDDVATYDAAEMDTIVGEGFQVPGYAVQAFGAPSEGDVGLPDAIYNQWVIPAAAYDPVNERTFINGVGAEGESRTAYTEGTTLYLANGGAHFIGIQDDHDNSAVLLPSDDPDSRLMQFWARHNGSSQTFHIDKMGDHPGAFWENDRTVNVGINTEYAQAWRGGDGTTLPDASRIFYMFHPGNWSVVHSDDEGVTWSAPHTAVTASTWQYSMVKRGLGAQSSKLLLMSNKHPKHHLSLGDQDIYVAIVDAMSGDVTIPGSGSVVVSDIWETNSYAPTTNGMRAFQSTGSGVTMLRTRLFSGQLYSDGTIDMVFARFYDVDDNNVVESGEYCFVRIQPNGTVGAAEVIASTGINLETAGSLYVGGIDVSESPPPGVQAEVALSRESGGVWSIEIHRRVGGVWSLHETVATGGTVKRFRPYYPANHSLGGLQLIWCVGRSGAANGGYTYLDDYSTDIVGRF